MKQMQIRKTGLLLLATGLLAFGAVGCSCSNDLKACQQENQVLAQQVAELEYQLQLADQAAAVQSLGVSAPAGTTYLVVQGDTMWSIATQQLGNGKRYKEILALNPQITQETLKIGTTLKLPAR